MDYKKEYRAIRGQYEDLSDQVDELLEKIGVKELSEAFKKLEEWAKTKEYLDQIKTLTGMDNYYNVVQRVDKLVRTGKGGQSKLQMMLEKLEFFGYPFPDHWIPLEVSRSSKKYEREVETYLDTLTKFTDIFGGRCYKCERCIKRLSKIPINHPEYPDPKTEAYDRINEIAGQYLLAMDLRDQILREHPDAPAELVVSVEEIKTKPFYYRYKFRIAPELYDPNEEVVDLPPWLQQ